MDTVIRVEARFRADDGRPVVGIAYFPFPENVGDAMGLFSTLIAGFLTGCMVFGSAPLPLNFGLSVISMTLPQQNQLEYRTYQGWWQSFSAVPVFRWSIGSPEEGGSRGEG